MAACGVGLVASTGFILLILNVVCAFQWTSDIQNGGKLQRCVGDNVTFPWSYVTEREENIIVQFWFSNKSGSFASYFSDHFMTSWDRVTQAGQAGVTLYDVSTADEDTYGISVMLYDGQEPLTQHINLTVAEPPRTDGQLHVIERTQNSTGARNMSRPQVRLKCGEFLSLGSPHVSVFWTDPSGHRLPSTTFLDGYFHLDLDPHARGGNYTCSVQREAEATQCLASDSPLMMAAGYRLVTMETVVLDQGTELRQLRRTLEELSQQLALSHVTHTNTSGALWDTVTALEQRQTNFTEVLEGQVAELHNTETELLQVSVEQNNTISSLQSQSADLQKQNTVQDSQVSSLQSQVADLQKQNTDQDTQVSSLQSQVADLKNLLLELRQSSLRHDTQIPGLQKQISDQNTQISSLQKQNTDQNAHISDLEKENFDKNTQITNLLNQESEQNSQISGLQKQVSDQNSKISGLQKQVSDQNTQISGLQKQVSDQNTQISGLQKQVSDQNTQISSLQSNLQNANTELRKVDADINLKLGDIDRNLTLVTSHLSTKMDNLQISQEILSSDLRTQTQQMTSMQTSVTSLQSEVKRGGTTLTTLQTELARISSLTAPLQNRAGFHAVLLSSEVAANKPVVFSLVSHVGGGYDARSGVYTAPYSGWYTLQAQLFPHRDSDKDVWFDIMQNGVKKARASCYQRATGTFTCNTSISMLVTAGDRLWVQPQNSDTYWIAAFDNFFTGVLVTPEGQQQ